MSDYYESADDLTITLKRALKEVADHYADVAEFYEDMGQHEFYKAQDVLNWLGY